MRRCRSSVGAARSKTNCGVRRLRVLHQSTPPAHRRVALGGLQRRRNAGAGRVVGDGVVDRPQPFASAADAPPKAPPSTAAAPTFFRAGIQPASRPRSARPPAPSAAPPPSRRHWRRPRWPRRRRRGRRPLPRRFAAGHNRAATLRRDRAPSPAGCPPARRRSPPVSRVPHPRRP